MNTAEILDLKKILSTPKKVVIVPHKNPDGDAMGSTLGLYHYLEKLGHSATVIAPNDYPEFLKWIPGTESVVIHEKELDVIYIMATTNGGHSRPSFFLLT